MRIQSKMWALFSSELQLWKWGPSYFCEQLNIRMYKSIIEASSDALHLISRVLWWNLRRILPPGQLMRAWKRLLYCLDWILERFSGVRPLCMSLCLWSVMLSLSWYWWGYGMLIRESGYSPQIQYISTAKEDGSDERCEQLGWKRLQHFSPSSEAWKLLDHQAASSMEDSTSEEIALTDDMYFPRQPFASLLACCKVILDHLHGLFLCPFMNHWSFRMIAGTRSEGGLCPLLLCWGR